MAQLLANYSTRVQKGDLVIITGNENAMPLYKELFRYVFKAGGYPHYSTLLPGYYDAMWSHPLVEIFLSEASDDQINQFTRLMLFDEKIGGTIHIALGEGYPATGSKNISGIHWDMLCDLRKDGEIYGDDEVIYRNGKFLF